jgi:hypothetical protein
MPVVDMREFKRQFGIPESVRNRAAVNAAIRTCMPGGASVLDVIERLIKMQHGRGKPDPALQDMLDKLATAREQMAKALISGVAINYYLELELSLKTTRSVVVSDT